jgi:uncharacterized membrane protein YbhN (UPF0104 family)
VLLVSSAGIGARSFSPTPDGIVVEAAMITTLVVAGVRPPQAVAAVLIHRYGGAGGTPFHRPGAANARRREP